MDVCLLCVVRQRCRARDDYDDDNNNNNKYSKLNCAVLLCKKTA
jgi:hypothetical protein